MTEQSEYPNTRDDVLTLAYRLIESVPTWDTKLFQHLRSHFHGLTSEWCTSGLITEVDVDCFRSALDVALALEKAKRNRPKTPWWDIASRIGF